MHLPVFTEVQGAGRIAVNTHLVFDSARIDVIGFSQAAVRVYADFGDEEDGDSLGSGRIAFDPGQNGMYDIFRQVMVSGGYETLGACNGIGPIRIGPGRGFQGADVGPPHQAPSGTLSLPRCRRTSC